MAIFGRNKKKSGVAVPPRRQPDPHIPRQINGFKPRSADILREFRQLQDVYDAIAYITEKHPDASMAVQTYVRLANNGHTMEIYGPDGGRLAEAEAMWHSFCQRIGDNAKGFDALIDQCHAAQIKYGGMGVEAVVRQDLSDIDCLLPILPQWLEWELDDAGVWHPYQRQKFGRVDLSTGNFFWVALDSEPGKPTGPLPMESALLTLDNKVYTERMADYVDNLTVCLDGLLDDYTEEVRAGLRSGSAQDDLNREELNATERGILTRRMVAGVLAVLDSYSTGSRMDVDNPALEKYIAGPLYKPARTKVPGAPITGRPEGLYTNIFGQ